MKAITVRQPWAWAIVHGGKDVENRTRNIVGAYRGLVAIHAGLTEDLAVLEYEHPMSGLLFPPCPNSRPTHNALRCDWCRAASADRWGDRGNVIGVAEIVSVHECRSHRGDSGVPDCAHSGAPLGVTCSPWAEFHPGRTIHHIRLANPRPLARPVPARGFLGLWTLPAGVEAAVLEQLGGAA